MSNKIRLHRAHIRKIQKVLDRFPDEPEFNLYAKSCGIGTTIYMEIPEYTFSHLECTLVFEIAGSEDW